MCPEEDYSLQLMLAINFDGILMIKFWLELKKMCNYMTHRSCLID